MTGQVPDRKFMQDIEQEDYEKQNQEKFLPLKQNTVTNYLARFNTKNKKEDFKSNNNIYTARYGKTDITILYSLDDYPKEVPNIYVRCQKLQRYIMCCFTANGFSSNDVHISVQELLCSLGLADNKRNRDSIRKDLIKLQGTKIDFTERRKVAKGFKDINGTFNIISSWSWKTSYITVEISKVLIDTLNTYGGIIQYPVSNFKLSNKFMLEFSINDRIAERLSNNAGVSISCKKLYECAVEAGMQSYEKISKKTARKSFTAAIVKPIENALNTGKFYTWKYRKSDKHSTFNDWLADYVEVTKVNILLPSKDGKKCEEVV